MAATILSENAKNIISLFEEKVRTDIFSNHRISLAVSLYANIINNSGDKAELEIARKVLSILTDKLIEIKNFLDNDEIDILKKEFAAVVNYCFDFSSTRFQAEEEIGISDPWEITSFINSLYTKKPNLVVYSPFMGMGSHILTADEAIQFEGEEYNERVWAYSHISMFANGKKVNISIGDSFVNLRNPEKKFDTIVLMPPMGMKRGSHNEFSAVLDAVEHKLQAGGELIALLPSDFTNSTKGEAYKLREILFEKRYIVSIMTLPPVMGWSSLKPSLLIVKKERQERIVFFNFASLMPKDEYLRKFSYKSALEAMEQHNSQYGRSIAYEDIRIGNNLNLTPAIKIHNLPSTSYPVRPLSELIKPFHQPILRNGNYYSLETDGFQAITCVEEPEIAYGNSHRVDKGVKALPSTLALVRKPTLKFIITPNFEENGAQEYILPLGTEFFDIINKELSKDYLEAILNSPFVMDQIELQERDNRIPFKLDLSEVTVPFPSKVDQEKIINDFKKSQRERNAHLAKIYSERAGIRDMAKDLKHMLGTPFNNVFNALASLERSIGNDKKLSSYLARVKDNLGYAKRIIVRDGVDFGDDYDFPKEQINIKNFFKEYETGWNNYGSSSFKLIVDIDASDTDYIYGNPDALRIMLDAFLENAHRHGFLRKYKEENQVTISGTTIGLKDDELLLNIHNNGRPLPPDLTFQDFITSGNFNSESGHSGLGGNHIYEIIKSFDGEFYIPFIEEADPFFVVTIPANR